MKRYLLVAATLCAAISCAPLPIYRLHPVAQSTRWLQGREFVHAASTGLEAEVAFDRTAGHDLVFEIWLRNNATQSVVVAPEKFYLLPEKKPPANDAQSARLVYALNPEAKLLEIDKEFSKEQASHATSSALEATSLVLGVVADLASKETKTEEQLAEDEREQREEEIVRHERERRHENKLARLQQERAYWEGQPLRKTTLAAREEIEGLVYFPAQVAKEARRVELVLPVGETRLVFQFSLEKIKP